jgi:hypothetical protein
MTSLWVHLSQLGDSRWLLGWTPQWTPLEPIIESV